ncbi:MAG: FAD-dependent oxidoreductase, partial [Clostridia bacterium]|nr:FAD-dependent oxidoreductase [Clostridia bacterium]
MSKKVVIVGGVAGGASTAARLRRLDETAEIIIMERGPFISFANCGLPYHIGGTISDRHELILQMPEDMKTRFNIDVRIFNEVTAINRDRKTVSVLKNNTGETYEESYDKLVLSPGSTPFVPPIPGIEADNHFVLWTIPDMDKII